MSPVAAFLAGRLTKAEDSALDGSQAADEWQNQNTTKERSKVKGDRSE